MAEKTKETKGQEKKIFISDVNSENVVDVLNDEQRIDAMIVQQAGEQLQKETEEAKRRETMHTIGVANYNVLYALLVLRKQRAESEVVKKILAMQNGAMKQLIGGKVEKGQHVIVDLESMKEEKDGTEWKPGTITHTQYDEIQDKINEKAKKLRNEAKAYFDKNYKVLRDGPWGRYRYSSELCIEDRRGMWGY
jgi:hypothetical protein